MKENLIFSSIGDFAQLPNWIGSDQNYDIWITYYGDDENKYNYYKQYVQFIKKSKGSKFQNFNLIWKEFHSELNKYERFFILDDDIIFDSYKDINKMFNFAKDQSTWICGPTFKSSGKISHKITQTDEGASFRYVNFVEINTPLFSNFAINKFMKHYDDSLIGWGIDFCYIQILGHSAKNRYALVDEVSVINPLPQKALDLCKINNIDFSSQDFTSSEKRIELQEFLEQPTETSGRELMNIEGAENRSLTWKSFCQKNQIRQRFELKNWEVIKKIKKILITRMLGNDLSGLHGEEQTLRNLEFTLKEEPHFDNVDKLFILNRIACNYKKQKIINLLNEYDASYAEIPFCFESFQQLTNVSSELKLEHFDENKNIDFILRQLFEHNLYLVNNNACRNFAIEYGKKREYGWTFVLDSNNFFTEQLFSDIITNINFSSEYLAIPQKRLQDGYLPNQILRCEGFERLLEYLPNQEPQLAFKHTSNITFNQFIPYGLSPKAELLNALNIQGKWNNWQEYIRLGIKPRNFPAARTQTLSSVIRLNPHCEENNINQNWISRWKGIYLLSEQLSNKKYL
tara:strand:- start:12414 stop:14126 length:1713 start_codon:yes stop_codon:yes gene_type:complete